MNKEGRKTRSEACLLFRREWQAIDIFSKKSDVQNNLICVLGMSLKGEDGWDVGERRSWR